MRISPVGSLQPLTSLTKIDKTDPSSGGGISFKDTMKNAIGEVNNLQTKADDLAGKLASGEIEDVHKAMLAMNKAKSAFDFTLAVRNKVLDAYQEIMRMQV